MSNERSELLAWQYLVFEAAKLLTAHGEAPAWLDDQAQRQWNRRYGSFLTASNKLMDRELEQRLAAKGEA